MEFPASYDDIARFEDLNKVCVFVYHQRGGEDRQGEGRESRIFAERYSLSFEDRAGGELALHLHQAH